VGSSMRLMLTALIAFGMSAAAGAQTHEHRSDPPVPARASAFRSRKSDYLCRRWDAAVARDRPAVSGRCRTHT